MMFGLSKSVLVDIASMAFLKLPVNATVADDKNGF